jgi:hypothetical protein
MKHNLLPQFIIIIIVGIVFIISGITALGGPSSAVPFVHFLIGGLLIGGAAFWYSAPR